MHGDAFDREERTFRARTGQDKHDLVYHIFTACQMISCKYKYFEWVAGLRGCKPLSDPRDEANILIDVVVGY